MLYRFNGRLYIYADDKVIVVAHKDFVQAEALAQSDYNTLLRWAHDKKLTINTRKTIVMNFHSSHNIPVRQPHIRSHDCNCLKNNLELNCTCSLLTVVKETKYLGVMIDNKLKWETHINILLNKLKPISAKLYYLRNTLPHSALTLIYKSLFESHILYGVEVWGTAPKTFMSRVESLQRRTLANISRHLYFIDVGNVQQLFTFYNTLYPHEYYKLKLFKKFNNSSKFKISNEKSEYEFRNLELYKIPRFCNTYGKNSLSYAIPKLINAIPIHLHSQLNFKKIRPALLSYLSEAYV